jgi:hypothetical protein
VDSALAGLRLFAAVFELRGVDFDLALLLTTQSIAAANCGALERGA